MYAIFQVFRVPRSGIFMLRQTQNDIKLEVATMEFSASIRGWLADLSQIVEGYAELIKLMVWIQIYRIKNSMSEWKIQRNRILIRFNDLLSFLSMLTCLYYVFFSVNNYVM